LKDFQQQTNSNDPIKDKIKNVNSETESKDKKPKGIKPDQAVELFASLTANFIPDVKIKNPNGQVVNVRQSFKDQYKQGKADVLKIIDFEELTEGGDLSELPEWVRWAIAGGVLGIPAVFSVVKLRKEINQMQKTDSSKKENKGG